VNIVNNKISHVVDLWLYSIVGGYITKFVVDFTQSYSATERDLFKGLHIRYLKYLD